MQMRNWLVGLAAALVIGLLRRRRPQRARRCR